MELIVDLHVHSHYSRATSKDCTLEGLYRWGKIKGIHIIGTGDFTHPLWFKEIQDKLEPAEPGLYKLKDVISKKIDITLPDSIKNNLIRFVLTVEISNIYSKGGKLRKVHNLVVVPSFAVAANMNSRLQKIGNLRADGRPILGLDSKELLKITLSASQDSLFIPAHVWTPWFGLFGSKSGFDSIQEAFEELAPEIKAIETGLSSDPFMNWRVAELLNVTIISNSDAHSPQKLGREATILESKVEYTDIINAIRTNDKRLTGTIEFYPEEGKYHYDGHRVCSIRFSPEQTKEHRGICPICHRSLTIGVNYRVNELSKRSEEYNPAKLKNVEYIIPLTEVLAQIYGVKSPTKKVMTEYERIYSLLGDEFSILRKISIAEIKYIHPELAQAIQKVRTGDITITPGYDGVYGTINLTMNSY